MTSQQLNLDTSATGIPFFSHLMDKRHGSAPTYRLPSIFTPALPKKSLTKTYSRNKVGLLSSQTANVQLLRSIALSRSLAVALANRDVSSATLIRGQMLEARKIAESQIMAGLQNMRRSSTEHGDFAGIYRGGF